MFDEPTFEVSAFGTIQKLQVERTVEVRSPVSRALVESGMVYERLMATAQIELQRELAGRTYRITDVRFRANESFERGPDEFDAVLTMTIAMTTTAVAP